jgi:hypothetical protein
MDDLFKVCVGLFALSSPIWGMLAIGLLSERYPDLFDRLTGGADSTDRDAS